MTKIGLMEHAVLYKEDENKKKGMIVSFMIHTLLLLLCLIPYLRSDDETQEISGIMVAFGIPEAGSSEANPISDSNEETEEKTASDSSPKQNNTSTATSKEKNTTEPTSSKKPISDISPISKTSDVAVEESNREKARKAAEAAEAEKKQRQADELARKEAQRKADEEAKKAAYDKSKSKFSDLFGSGDGSNNENGNEGNPAGDPNSKVLLDVATGSGRIGGGLKNRSVVFEPEIRDKSQKTGVVVVKVCVNKAGKVIEAKYTQSGSTTTDDFLRKIAIEASEKYKFAPSDIEIQCGNITIEFKVK